MYDVHPAIAAPMGTRIEYARVVASILKTDQELANDELESLRGLCGALGLTPGATEGVLLFALDPQPERVRTAVESLGETDLKLTLITDLVALAMSDGKYHISERKHIHALAALLLVGADEIASIEDYVARSLGGAEPVITDVAGLDERRSFVPMAGDFAASLAAAGVPLAVVWMMSPPELSVSGVARALDDLSFGMGPLAGAAIDIALGLFAYLFIRIAYDVIVGKE